MTLLAGLIGSQMKFSKLIVASVLALTITTSAKPIEDVEKVDHISNLIKRKEIGQNIPIREVAAVVKNDYIMEQIIKNESDKVTGKRAKGEVKNKREAKEIPNFSKVKRGRNP